jgi:hypothetical protein
MFTWTTSQRIRAAPMRTMPEVDPPSAPSPRSSEEAHRRDAQMDAEWRTQRLEERGGRFLLLALLMRLWRWAGEP